MRTCDSNSEDRSIRNFSRTDCSTSSNRYTRQRTTLTRVQSNEHTTDYDNSSSYPNIVRRVSSCVSIRDDFYNSINRELLPDGCDAFVDKTSSDVSPAIHLDNMACRPNRHTEYCCHYHSFPFAVWIYYIKPAAQVSIVLLFGFGLLSVFNQYNAMLKSLDIVTIQLHKIKRDLESFSKNLQHTNEAQERADLQITEISMILNKLTNLTNQTSEYTLSIEKDYLNLYQMFKSTENIRETIKREIDEYNADKTSKSDYALESAGGQVLSVLSTKPYIIETDSFLSRGWNYLSNSFCSPTKAARAILQPSVNPGQCWAFQGSSGAVVVQLLTRVVVSGLTLEHIPAAISPTQEISSAPKTFSLWGIDSPDELDGFFFGEFTYDKEGPPVQYFQIQYHSNTVYNIVMMKVHSNWGNHDYTCVYRLRVHGSINRFLSNNHSEL